jgi:hypothetical protein
MLSNSPSVAMRIISPGITEMDAKSSEKREDVKKKYNVRRRKESLGDAVKDD